MMPSANAASVPMRIGMYQSATCADRVRRGSITTSGTPRLRTCSTFAQKCTLVANRSAPQQITRSDSTTDSGSAPPIGPTVASHAASLQLSHTVPAHSRLVPIAWNRPFGRPRFISP